MMSYTSFKELILVLQKSQTKIPSSTATDAAIIPKQEISRRNTGLFQTTTSLPHFQKYKFILFAPNSQVAIVFLLLWLLQLIEQAFSRLN